MKNNYYIWVEIEANKKRLLDEKKFNILLDKCVSSGIDSIILSIKDTSGFGIHKSKVVPHYSNFDKDFKEEDYLEKYIDKCHEKGLKIYAAFDVFAEGWNKKKHKSSPGFINTHWQTQMYGLDKEGNTLIKPIGDLQGMDTIGSIDDFQEIFVNPVMDEVKDYELSIIKEVIDNYSIDGIVLDRVRFIGLGSDFSDFTRKEFEDFIDHKVNNWPEDIYKLERKENDIDIIYGELFGKWLTFRAHHIKKFILMVREAVDNCGKDIEFVDYTGSWYPIYYLVGANWAREGYVPEDYPWVDKNYGATGYAEYIDTLLSGFYYEDVYIEDALKNGKPHYWYSVEGSGDIVDKVVGSATNVAGSLYVKQYENNPEKFKEAVEMCFKKSKGCMIFDLCYIDDYNWWDWCKVK